jgi:hypothetical protein
MDSTFVEDEFEKPIISVTRPDSRATVDKGKAGTIAASCHTHADGITAK